MEQTLYLSLKKNGLHHFFPLFQQGVIITTLVGGNIKDLLSLQLEIPPDYVENRIQTIFLDGKAVDDLGETMIRDGSTLALSAADKRRGDCQSRHRSQNASVQRHPPGHHFVGTKRRKIGLDHATCRSTCSTLT